MVFFARFFLAISLLVHHAVWLRYVRLLPYCCLAASALRGTNAYSEKSYY